MNLEKFTDRAKGFLQSAQTVAIRNNHQRISSEHLLKALLEDSEGMAAGLIARAGGDAKLAVRDIDAALAKIPAVSAAGRSRRQGWTMMRSARWIRPNRWLSKPVTALSPSNGCYWRSFWPRTRLPEERWPPQA